jgi:formiminotetrahydrofolate cyclodeaminase
MIETREKAESLRAELTGLINEDAEAFAAVMNAFRLPKETEDDKLNRELAIQAATKRATLSPLATARACADVIELCQTVAEQGNPNAISDAGAAAACAQAGLKAASLNVLINLPSINDREFVTTQRAELDWILNKQVGADEVFALVKGRL